MGITCKQAVDYISKKEEGKLSASQRFKLWQHLAICRFCRAFNRQNRLLVSIFKQRPKAVFNMDKVDKEAIIATLQNATD